MGFWGGIQGVGYAGVGYPMGVGFPRGWGIQERVHPMEGTWDQR